MKFLFTCIAVCICIHASAQQFLKKPEHQAFSLKEMQRQFNDWARTHDLKKEKHWKYFKRWEMDMQMHSTAQGEAVDPSIYIKEAIQSAAEKEQQSALKTNTATWYPVGPSLLPTNQTGYMENGLGRINCMAFDPLNASTYYVGVAQGGLWKTTNNGQSWVPLTDMLPITRISDIAIDPTNTNTIYISVCDFEYIDFGLALNGKKRNTHYGLGVYKTTDGGLSWQPTGLSFQLTNGEASLIRKVLVHPAHNNKLLACGVSGMYASIDAGQSWAKTLDSLFWDLTMDPTDPNILYAATGWVKNANMGYAAVYKSTDFGVNWVKLNTHIPARDSVQRVKLAIAPSDNNYVYALTVDVNGGLFGIYKSTDAGNNWQFLNPGVNILEGNDGSGTGGQGTYDLGLMVNNQNKNLLYVGGVNIWGSADGAVTFNPISHWTLNYGPTIHGDIHFIEQQAQTGNIFVCSDGGIYRTANVVMGSWNDANNGVPWPTQWSKISDGMQITSFYRLSSSKNTTGRLMAGAQDNASFYYDGTAWSTIFGGDGMDNYLDPLNDFGIIGSSQYGNFDLSTDGGLSSSFINPNVNAEVAEWTTPLSADYNQPGTLYTGYANVNKSSDGGMTWSSISNFTPNPNVFFDNEISALAVSNSNGNVIYAAKRVRYEYPTAGSVYRTGNGGSTWTDITAGLPDSLYYTSLEVSETDENTAYITMAGFSGGIKVFKTSNGGASWQNISYNLANAPVNCIKYIPGTADVVVATDFGIYVLANNTTTWVNKGQGLPNAIVSDIEFNAALNKVYLCTFGRGIWASDLDAFISIRDISKINPGFDLYPTLNNGTFTIRLDETNNYADNAISLDIIDVTGKLVCSSKLSGHNSYQPQLNLSSGMYFAKVRGKNINAVKRFVVE